MSHLSSHGDHVFGQIGFPAVAWSDGRVETIFNGRATQCGWRELEDGDLRVVCNLQLHPDEILPDGTKLEFWFPCEWRADTKKWTVLVERPCRVVKCGGSVWAVDDGPDVRTSWGLMLPNTALCAVGTDGAVYVTMRPDAIGLLRVNADGSMESISTGQISRAAEDTHAGDGGVSWQEVDGVHYWPEVAVTRTERPVVAWPIGG
ncbi:MAG: hypothetical protein ACREUQ_09790 [Burkholderiales bacterium]